ncbi:MAG: alpha-E domain-containing protein [Halieaceae bacterium]|jgi:uncharacterized alpha-E superfamily protein|nr:alpha-E domain-containing protein [Halieaceae bacterium]
MLSRVAESIYWIGRYTERAENTARLVNLNMNLLLDMPKHARPSWGNMVTMTGSEAAFKKRYKEDDERSVVRFLLIDAKNPSSMLNSLAMARENARTVRDIIPQSGWEHLNGLYRAAREGSKTGLNRKNRFAYLISVIRDIEALSGVLSSTMLHDSGYSFLRMGRMLERADMTSRIIDELSAGTVDSDPLGEAENSLRWMGLLKTLNAYHMYRREMEVAVERDPVLDFLLCCPTYPRSVMHCLNELAAELRKLPRFKAALGTCSDAHTLLNETDHTDLNQQGLHQHMDAIQLALVAINNEISRTYFQLSDD